jgi:hypothetical protein
MPGSQKTNQGILRNPALKKMVSSAWPAISQIRAEVNSPIIKIELPK